MRINWIDNIKWLWIILILAWHSYFTPWNMFFWYIFSFHVALFFFLSWYLFNDEKHKFIIPFIKEKFKRLIIPYFAFNIIFYIFIDIVKTEHHSLISVIKWTFYWSWLRWNDEIFLLNVSTWFLIALFFSSIFYFLLNKYIKNKIILIITLILISIIIHFESIYFKQIRLPFSIEPALMATFFYWIWHIYKKKIAYLVEKIRFYHILFLPILVYLNIKLATWSNFSTNEYWDNYFKFISSAFLWIITWIIIAKNIPKNLFLDYFWKNSIIILWMEFLKTRILWLWALLLPWIIIYERSLTAWTYQLILTIILMFPIIFIINKLFPFVIWGWYKKIKI